MRLATILGLLFVLACGKSKPAKDPSAETEGAESSTAGAVLGVMSSGLEGASNGLNNSSRTSRGGGKMCVRDSDCFRGEACVETRDATGVCAKRQR